MAEWPESLPPLLVEGYSRSGEDGVIRSQMDGGLKVRPRFTKPPYERVTAELVCTQAQLQTLLDFWEVTLQRVLPFNWTDPTKGGTAAVYRFAARPSYAPRNVGTYWQVSLQLEVISTTPGSFGLGLDNEDDEELTT